MRPKTYRPRRRRRSRSEPSPAAVRATLGVLRLELTQVLRQALPPGPLLGGVRRPEHHLMCAFTAIQAWIDRTRAATGAPLYCFCETSYGDRGVPHRLSEIVIEAASQDTVLALPVTWGSRICRVGPLAVGLAHPTCSERLIEFLADTCAAYMAPALAERA